MTFILFLFILFIFVLLFASSLVLAVVRWVLSLFGMGRRNGTSSRGGSDNRASGADGASSYSGRTTSGGASASGWHYSPEAEYKRRKRKKIIGQDEGEYVDYEEIKKE